MREPSNLDASYTSEERGKENGLGKKIAAQFKRLLARPIGVLE